jgi:hypothetical protein
VDGREIKRIAFICISTYHCEDIASLIAEISVRGIWRRQPGSIWLSLLAGEAEFQFSITGSTNQALSWQVRFEPDSV